MSIDGIAQISESQFLRAVDATLELKNAMPDFVARLRKDGVILELNVSEPSKLPRSIDRYLGINIADFLNGFIDQPLWGKLKKSLSTQRMLRFQGQQLIDNVNRDYDFLIIPSGDKEVVIVVTGVVWPDAKKEAFLKLNRTLLSLQSATSAVMLSLDIDQVLETFTWELTNLLDACSSVVLEWDPQHDLLRPLTLQDKEGCFANSINLGTHLGNCPSIKRVLHEKYAYQESINQVAKTSPEYEFMRIYSIRTFASFPLVFQDKTLGIVLAAKCQNGTVFEDQTISAAQLLTNQAAAAVANARLHKQTEQQLKFHSVLREAGQFFSSSLEQNTVLNSIAEKLCTNLNATSAYLLSYNAQEQSSTVLADHVTPYAHKKEQISDLGQTYKTDKSDQSFIREGRSKVWHIDDSDITIEEKNHMISYGAQSILAIPIIRSGKVVAFAQIWESRRKRDFTEFEIELAEGIGQLAALALDNAKLYQRARHEISERRRAEEALAIERASLADRVTEQTSELRIANAELARAARSKDEFLASMSHELRTPLNAILGITEGMKDSFYGPLTDQQHNSLQLVENSGLHLLELIDDILDLSRIESGQLTLDMTAVAVDDLCLGCIQLIRQSASKKQINISYSTDGQVHSIYADPRRLKQILINLLSNAVKFTPENGSVGLEVRTETENDQIHFTVWDTGIGISEEDRGRLFKPFSQLDSSLARRYGGTGLGLTLVKRMAELHKGSVSLNSEPDKGSRFTVSIPWKISGHSEPKNPAPSHDLTEQKIKQDKNKQIRQSESQNILLVEDDKINAKIYLDCINSMNLPVTLATNGHEAIESCQVLRPGLILMDIQLPGMDGLSAIQHIRKMPEMNDTHIIALTALAMAGDRDRCLEAGADMYLSKPVPLSTLKKVIRSYIEGTIPVTKSE